MITKADTTLIHFLLGLFIIPSENFKPEKVLEISLSMFS
jgi:hypothetical protein